MQTGENEQGLRKILDLTRMMSIAVLLLHYYNYCYGAFAAWGIRSKVTDRLLRNVAGTGLFDSFQKSKLTALTILAISLLGSRGKKDEKLTLKTAIGYFATGLGLYSLSGLVLSLDLSIQVKALSYILITTTGFLLFLTGGTFLSRIIRQKLSGSVFNTPTLTIRRRQRSFAWATIRRKHLPTGPFYPFTLPPSRGW